MACEIIYGSESVPANNFQFATLIDFAVEVAEASCRDSLEREHVTRLKRMRDEEFFPGRDMIIEEDFPELPERKFWSRIFFDTARAVFERSLGAHEHSFWQAQCIWQAYGVAMLLEKSVRDAEAGWFAQTRDRVEFDRVVNGRK